MDVSDILYFFFWSGRGEGKSETAGWSGSILYRKSQEGGGGFSRRGKGRGAGRVSAANWGIFLGGGGLNFFFFGAEMSTKVFIDLLMGLFRGAVFDHGGVPENCPLALMGRFHSLMGRFLTLMGRFPECLNGPFSLLKISWKTAH